MSNENNSKLTDTVFKKVKEMNVDKSKDILELIFLLQDNEIVNRNNLSEYPINRISETLGIAVYSADIKEEGTLFVDGTTYKIYGCNQVILTNQSYSLERQREIRASLLGIYLLDYLKKFDGDHRKVYIATYNKTNMNNKAHFFARELLTPRDIFAKQYTIAAEHHNNPIFIRKYLQAYFNVAPSFVENRINEIAYGDSLPLESTDPKTTNPNTNIIVFQRKL